ncbi:MAG: hypothetical protein J6X41_06125 [Spirochaetales bacterium]|nr:hypothetical protein [Spirochaetales bacterium]
MAESGVVALRNLKTDKVYLFFSRDIKKDCVSMRFQLDLGMFPCRSLQEDYTSTGLEVFRFDTIELTDDEKRLEELKKGLDLYV